MIVKEKSERNHNASGISRAETEEPQQKEIIATHLE
jgi:hypothetical protein